MPVNVLVLTDHTNHTAENSLYPLLRTMRSHPDCGRLDVATRVDVRNDLFFMSMDGSEIFAAEVSSLFGYSPDGKAFQHRLREVDTSEYDLIWLRLPPPLTRGFLEFVSSTFPNQTVVNSPRGIHEAGSKEFLLNFPKWTPPMQVIRTREELADFSSRFPVVLKPFRDYGGRGIVRIDGDTVWRGTEEITLGEFLDSLDNEMHYLGVKFLKNVSEGDKRIVVVDGQIMGASLRVPAPGSWICNVSMGGTSTAAKVAPEERAMVKALHPRLSELGLVMYGIDTLVGDDGKRVLSEINATSIGGLPQIAEQDGKPNLVLKAVDRILKAV